jgi:iron complex transport system substrate-binding protein
MSSRWPRRIVCLTEETTEVLYRLGAGDLVVGVSGYTVRPKEARKKPKVSAFIEADIPKIEALQPDLVLTFSDLQADIAAELQRRGLWVVSFNQRSIAEILRAIQLTGALVGLAPEAMRLADELERNLDAVRERGERLPKRPRVFFEEWPDPLISGIRWVSELISVAGGSDLFPECAMSQAAKGRIVSPEEVVRRDPELILASWCGRKAKLDQIVARPGWSGTSAVRGGFVGEIKSVTILQPGPASLTDGLAQLEHWVSAAAHGVRIEE